MPNSSDQPADPRDAKIRDQEATIKALRQTAAEHAVEREALATQAETLRTQLNEQANRRAKAAGVLPPDNAVPQESKCRHGADLDAEGKGCAAPCKNARCGHPCSAHAMNCLEQIDVPNPSGKGTTKRNCPCVGLSH